MPRRNHKPRRRGPAVAPSRTVGTSLSRRIASELIRLQRQRGVL